MKFLSWPIVAVITGLLILPSAPAVAQYYGPGAVGGAILGGVAGATVCPKGYGRKIACGVGGAFLGGAVGSRIDRPYGGYYPYGGYGGNPYYGNGYPPYGYRYPYSGGTVVYQEAPPPPVVIVPSQPQTQVVQSDIYFDTDLGRNCKSYPKRIVVNNLEYFATGKACLFEGGQWREVR